MTKFNSTFLFLLFILKHVYANEVLGCGGYVKSKVDMNYSQVSLKLLTVQGNLKYETECAPNNGYYFIPLYDKGEYILKVSPPSGWSFEPEEVTLKVDGENDPCSLSQDINFNFQGFAVIGKVISVGSDLGPAGVKVSLNQNNKEVMTTVTAEGGDYVFTPLASGEYEVKASHPSWAIINNKVSVSVKDQNGDAGSALVIGGYTLKGKIEADGKVAEMMTFVLHSKVKTAHKKGCVVGKPNGYKSISSDPVVCYATADRKGEYSFAGISPGSYDIVPFSKATKRNFDILPSSIKVQMSHEDQQIKETFKLNGCRIKGHVFMGKSRQILKGATVALDDGTTTKTDDQGAFSFDGVKFGKHSLKASAAGMEFNSLQITLGLKSVDSYELFPSKYETCFVVSVDSTAAKSTPWLLNIVGTNSKYETKTDSNGQGCQMLEPGKYSATVALSANDQESGIRFGPEEHHFEIGSEILNPMSFSQFLAEIQGSISCLESCKVLTVSMRPARMNTMAPRTTTSNQGKFVFKEVVPGDYLMTVDKEEWCWKQQTITVSVNSKKVTANFQQTGFRLTLNSSHRTTLLYTTNTGQSGSIAVAQGTSRECVSSAGKYSLTPSGCHKFGSTMLTWDTSAPQLLSLIATQHKVTGSLVFSERGSFSIQVKHLSGQEVSLGPLEASSPNVYNFEHWMTPGDKAIFTPVSPSNLFQYSPPSFELTVGNDCMTSFVKFVAERALFLKGTIVPAIKGVSIVITSQGEDPIQYNTNNDGQFMAGPLDKSRDYIVTAEKLGYTISPESHPIKSGSSSEVVKIVFDAYKLAEINVKIVDVANQEPLSNVLVSTSGGKDYRKNSLTEADGSISFLALMPADYFIRPMMKEYTFNPTSKMVTVKEGATVSVDISGTRIGYSIFGQTLSLSREPEGDVIVEAIGIADPCLGLQEEALSDAQGQFRIRGLTPKCDYKIRLKKGDGINQQVERSLPKEKVVRMEADDLKGMKVIVLRPFLQMDVSIYVHTEPQFLQSLSAELYREDAPDSAIQVLNVGSHPFFMLPPMIRDEQMYVLSLKSSLSRSLFSFNTPTATFKGNSSFIRLQLKFEPKLKSIEAEISRSTVLGFILFVFVVTIIVNYNKIQPMVDNIIDMYLNSARKSNYNKQSANTFESYNDQSTRKRVKVRKT